MMVFLVCSCSDPRSNGASDNLSADNVPSNPLSFYAEFWYATSNSLLPDDSVSTVTVQAVDSKGTLSTVLFNCTKNFYCTSNNPLPDGIYLVTTDSTKSNPKQAHLFTLGTGHTTAGTQLEPVKITTFDENISTYILGLMKTGSYDFQTAFVSKNTQYANPLRMFYEDYYYTNLNNTPTLTSLGTYLSKNPAVFFEFVTAPTQSQIQCSELPIEVPLGVPGIGVSVNINQTSIYNFTTGSSDGVARVTYTNAFPGDSIAFLVGENPLEDFFGSAIACSIPDCPINGSTVSGWVTTTSGASCQVCPANSISVKNLCQTCGPLSDRETNNACHCGTGPVCGATFSNNCTDGSCQCGTGPQCGSQNSDGCTGGACLCGSNPACSGSTDTCTQGACFCGTGPACTGTTDTCINGSCVCKANNNQPCNSRSAPVCSSVGCGCGDNGVRCSSEASCFIVPVGDSPSGYACSCSSSSQCASGLTCQLDPQTGLQFCLSVPTGCDLRNAGNFPNGCSCKTSLDCQYQYCADSSGQSLTACATGLACTCQTQPSQPCTGCSCYTNPNDCTNSPLGCAWAPSPFNLCSPG